MASHFTEDEISEHFHVFRTYDRTKEGRMQICDVPAAMIALGHNPTERELQKLIHDIPRDGRDYFEFPEFLTLMARHIQAMEPEETLRTAFRVFDKDGNGYLSAQELKMTMTLLGAQMSQSEIDYMISVTDVDGDGLINYDEFIRIMMSK
ncbi:calmodulin-like [Dreissena polymorpha]|uniref:EF-hand domain-containing protein n=1 Tax=Dreissena polymorpha TaxID=45954 RepID=A0A9D4LIC6_DREPO|nr:calmodulin-like [Dreissena polymorpha]KAH3859222.1 hypothetical protein DPMN_101938 [Dreissena polymorpha]